MRTRQGYLFKRGSTYYVAWRVNGKLFMRTTGETNRKAAEVKRAEIMQPFVAGNDAAVLQTLAARIQGQKAEVARLVEEQNPPLPFEQAWTVYVESPNRPDSGERTLSDYAGYFASFAAWMKEHHGDKPALRDVTPVTAAAYAVHLGKIGLSSNSFNKHIRFLELIYRVTRNRARLTENPWADIQRKRVVSASRRELTIEELRNVCLSAKGEMRNLFALGIYTGLRLGDCATLRWSEVDLARGLIRRIPNKTARRNPKPVLVPVHPVLRAMLNETPTNAHLDFVLPDMAALYLRSTSEMSKRVHNHFEACGVKTQKAGTGRLLQDGDDGRKHKVFTGKRAVVEVGFHSLRHSFVSLCREANAPLSVVEAIVGHSNPAMTRHYTHTGEAAAIAAVAALPSVVGGIAPPSLPAPKMVDAIVLRAALDRMDAENWRSIKSDLLALVS